MISLRLPKGLKKLSFSEVKSEIKNFDVSKLHLRTRSLRLLAYVDRAWPKVKKSLPDRLQPLAKKLETRVNELLEKIPTANAVAPDAAPAEPIAEENINPITHTASDEHPILEVRSRGASRWAIFDRGPESAPLKVFKSRASAVQAGKRIAKTRHAELRVFNQRGDVQNSYYLN